MIAYLIQVTICMAVFYSFYHIALRKETLFHSNRFYLLLTLLLSLVLPLIRIYVNQLHTNSMVMQAPVYVGSYFQNLENGITITPEEHSFPWMQALMIIYGAGVGLMVIRLFLSLRAIVILKSQATKLVIENQVCAVSPQVKSPFSFFHTIYLPANHSFTEEELKEVICHEHAHVAGKHSWDVMFMEMVGILFWANPLIYLYRKALKEIHEYIADAAVVKKTPWPVYSEFLIQQRFQAFQNNLSSPLNYSVLKKRMSMMSSEGSSVQTKWKYFWIFPLVVVLLLFISCREDNSDHLQVTTDASSGKEKIDTIRMNAQLQYFMNGYAISNDQLQSAILTSANHNLERRVILRADRTNTVKEVADVLEVADKVYARMILVTED